MPIGVLDIQLAVGVVDRKVGPGATHTIARYRELRLVQTQAAETTGAHGDEAIGRE